MRVLQSHNIIPDHLSVQVMYLLKKMKVLLGLQYRGRFSVGNAAHVGR
jgi:hypothetical protein